MQVGESMNVRRVQRPGGPVKHLTRTASVEAQRPRRGLKIDRRYTSAAQDVFESVVWTQRTANIGEGGKTVFEQKDIEVPSFWSQLATNVVVSKYFRGHVGTPGRERSVKQLIGRSRSVRWAEESTRLNNRAERRSRR